MLAYSQDVVPYMHKEPCRVPCSQETALEWVKGRVLELPGFVLPVH